MTVAKSSGSESKIKHKRKVMVFTKSYGIELKPLNIVYCSRVGFGVVAALVCVLLIDVKEPTNPLISGMSIAILVYLITYYVLKWLFMTKVEKQSKVLTMGIGAYFLTWIVAWVLFNTLMFH